MANENPLNMPDFSDIETWIFDLDNTLYPSSIGLFDEIDRRMCEFIADYLGIGRAAAYRKQKSYFREHGTTLRGLMINHQIDPEPYLDYVHAIDVGIVVPDPALCKAIGGLKGRKVIFTNATTGHAQRVMDRLGVSRHFDAIFDISQGGYLPKPDPAAYDTMIDALGIDALTAVMIEDVARNLGPARALGMTTVWLADDTPWATAGIDGVKPDLIIDDLTAWLERVGDQN